MTVWSESAGGESLPGSTQWLSNLKFKPGVTGTVVTSHCDDHGRVMRPGPGPLGTVTGRG